MLGEFKVPGKRFVELLLLIKFSPGSNLGPKFIHGDRKRKARMGSLHENGGEQGSGGKENFRIFGRSRFSEKFQSKNSAKKRKLLLCTHF